MSDWKQALLDHWPHLPFMVSAVRPPSDMRANLTRILEALIIAGITGTITMYGIQIKLDAQMANLRERIAEDRAEWRTQLKDLRSETVDNQRRMEDRINNLHSFDSMNGNGFKGPAIDRRVR